MFPVCVLALGLFAASPALAQSNAMSYGVRAGVSADPNQFVIGAHVESPRLGLTQRVSFRPNAELGFGSDQTTLSGNVEFVVWVPFPNSNWSAYLGGGPSANLIKVTGDSHVGGGLNILAGFQNKQGIFAEIKTGTAFAPGLRATVGYILKRR
jgi:hypothetical protein